MKTPHPAATASVIPLLDSATQRKWLGQHIPHRIRAVLPGLRHMPDPWNMPLELPNTVPNRCIANCVNEGRHSAMRWLIFFVGIMEKNGTAIETIYTTKLTDVWIGRFSGGRLFDPHSADAIKLAQVYKGCTQATGHPTDGTEHPDIRERPLSEALLIIIDHLRKTIYDAQGRDLVHYTLRLDDLPRQTA